MISLELCVQYLDAAISSLLDPNHEWKPEIHLFSLGEGVSFSLGGSTDRHPDN
jgi:hypothetical protein